MVERVDTVYQIIQEPTSLLEVDVPFGTEKVHTMHRFETQSEHENITVKRGGADIITGFLK